MNVTRVASFACLLAGAAIALVGIAKQPDVGKTKATEAPAGFETPLLQQNPGSQSVSNGIPEPTGDTFALDQQNFEQREGNDSGLGPVYNATACADCHQNPVTGGPSQITEIRAGHKDANGNFVNPTVTINDGADTITGRSIVNDRAICPALKLDGVVKWQRLVVKTPRPSTASWRPQSHQGREIEEGEPIAPPGREVDPTEVANSPRRVVGTATRTSPEAGVPDATRRSVLVANLAPSVAPYSRENATLVTPDSLER